MLSPKRKGSTQKIEIRVPLGNGQPTGNHKGDLILYLKMSFLKE